MCCGTCSLHASGAIQRADRGHSKKQKCCSEKHCSLTCESLTVVAELDHQQLLLGCKASSGMLDPVLQTPMQDNVSRQAVDEHRLLPQLDIYASHLCWLPQRFAYLASTCDVGGFVYSSRTGMRVSYMGIFWSK